MRISDWSSDVCSSDLYADRSGHRILRRIGRGRSRDRARDLSIGWPRPSGLSRLRRFRRAHCRLVAASCRGTREIGRFGIDISVEMAMQKAVDGIPAKFPRERLILLHIQASRCPHVFDRVLQLVTGAALIPVDVVLARSEAHTSELQTLMRISYAVICLKQKKKY